MVITQEIKRDNIRMVKTILISNKKISNNTKNYILILDSGGGTHGNIIPKEWMILRRTNILSVMSPYKTREDKNLSYHKHNKKSYSRWGKRRIIYNE